MHQGRDKGPVSLHRERVADGDVSFCRAISQGQHFAFLGPWKLPTLDTSLDPFLGLPVVGWESGLTERDLRCGCSDGTSCFETEGERERESLGAKERQVFCTLW